MLQNSKSNGPLGSNHFFIFLLTCESNGPPKNKGHFDEVTKRENSLFSSAMWIKHSGQSLGDACYSMYQLLVIAYPVLLFRSPDFIIELEKK